MTMGWRVAYTSARLYPSQPPPPPTSCFPRGRRPPNQVIVIENVAFPKTRYLGSDYTRVEKLDSLILNFRLNRSLIQNTSIVIEDKKKKRRKRKGKGNSKTRCAQGWMRRIGGSTMTTPLRKSNGASRKEQRRLMFPRVWSGRKAG